MWIFSKLSHLFRKKRIGKKVQVQSEKLSFSNSQLIYAGAGLEQIREIKVKVDNIEDWLRYEGVSKSWFNQEFKDEAPEIFQIIMKKIENIENMLKNMHLPYKKPVDAEKEFVVVKEPEKIKYEYVLSPIDMEIVEILSREKKPLNFTILMKKAGISRQTLSNHLKDLIRIGKIRKKHKGKYTYYSIK